MICEFYKHGVDNELYKLKKKIDKHFERNAHKWAEVLAPKCLGKKVVCMQISPSGIEVTRTHFQQKFLQNPVLLY